MRASGGHTRDKRRRYTLWIVERAAVADGSRFREVQRELRGSKPKSRGTEIEIDEVASDLEQYRNDIVGCVENNLHVRA